jgi:PTH2 family peptidyl-tRNA hydrolase
MRIFLKDKTMSDVKQVIIIRKDLKMRRGKEIAQGSHASMAFLSNMFLQSLNSKNFKLPNNVKEWLEGSFTKVCLQVDSEENLLKIFNKAKQKGLIAEIIKDSGLTEFNGIPTITAIAIGPNLNSQIDEITGSNGEFSEFLKLY